MSKWKHWVSCRAVVSKNQGHGGKTIFCILDMISGYILEKTCKAVLMKSLLIWRYRRLSMWFVLDLPLHIFIWKKTPKQTNVGEKKTHYHSSSVQSERGQPWYAETGQLQPCGCFQLGWTIKYGQAGLDSSALVLHHTGYDQKRAEWMQFGRVEPVHTKRSSIKRSQGRAVADISRF